MEIKITSCKFHEINLSLVKDIYICVIYNIVAFDYGNYFQNFKRNFMFLKQ